MSAIMYLVGYYGYLLSRAVVVRSNISEVSFQMKRGVEKGYYNYRKKLIDLVKKRYIKKVYLVNNYDEIEKDFKNKRLREASYIYFIRGDLTEKRKDVTKDFGNEDNNLIEKLFTYDANNVGMYYMFKQGDYLNLFRLF